MSITVYGFLHSLWDRNWHFFLFQILLTGHRENHFLSLEDDLTRGNSNLDNDILEVGCGACYRTFHYQQQSVILALESTKSNSKIVVIGGWTDGWLRNMLVLHEDLISILQNSHRKRKGGCYTGFPVPLCSQCCWPLSAFGLLVLLGSLYLCAANAFGFPVLLGSQYSWAPSAAELPVLMGSQYWGGPGRVSLELASQLVWTMAELQRQTPYL